MSAPVTLPDGGRFGRFEILLAERRLQADGQPIALGSRAFDLLAALVARRDRVVPKEELITVVWPGLVVEDNNLQVQISALRKVLGTSSIATVPGRGYQFTVAASSPSGTAEGSAVSSATGSTSTWVATWRSPDRGHLAMRKSRLLVADDNKVNRLLLCRSLELMGHDVDSAENGRLALQKLRSEHFDMLVLDLEMPEMDGFELLGQRATDPVLRDMPVIVTSSIEGAAQVARCIELGADDFLHKPVNPMLLKARVDSSLERKHLRDRERELLARLAPPLAEGRPVPHAMQAARQVDATVLVVRLRDVDGLAASSSPQETLESLSNWSTLMTDAVESHGGVAIASTGDAITAVFGATEAASGATTDGDGASWAAVQSAFEMRELVAGFNAERVATGKATVAIGVGIASGLVVTGQAGTPKRPVYVCVGVALQRAAALEAITGSPGDVLMDAATQAALADRTSTVALKPLMLPGGAKAVPVHGLKAG